MGLHDALTLVRTKYLEEQKGVTSSPTADRYRQAIQDFPATLAVAHQLWARELAKGLP